MNVSGAKLSAYSEVDSITGLIFTAAILPGSGGFFVIQGYAPNSLGVKRFNVVEGRPIEGNREIMVGRMISSSMKKSVGESIELGNSRYKVVGIYESSVSFEEMGGVMTLRDAQNFVGKPRKVTMYSVKLKDPGKATDMVARINSDIPDVHAALTGEFTNEMPDMQNSTAMVNGISFVAIFLGGLGLMNTMLMAVIGTDPRNWCPSVDGLAKAGCSGAYCQGVGITGCSGRRFRNNNGCWFHMVNDL